MTHFWPKEDKNLYLKEAKKIFQNTLVAEEGKKLILKGKLDEFYFDLEKEKDMHSCQDLNWKQLIKEYKENEKNIDLHTHTNYSDGELSIDELIKLAIKKKMVY